MMYHQPSGPQMTTIMAYGDTNQHLPQGTATIAYTQIPGVAYGPPGSLAVVHGGTLRRGQNMSMMPSVVPNLLHNAPQMHMLPSDITMMSPGDVSTLQRQPPGQHFYYG
ncbi:uncharacterized protein LOC113378435 [Ctenocephalides felis]|uniref:uncharacterized protein LOC113378435 n=1 Tax=Ctenocephalides felis TaxID=7515 RepID=UPI000E6E5286|nr:uncharacterized protein LOC113378435 [Ctenocephalides felis]